MFKPMLAPQEKVDLSTLQYPVLVSYKLDGIRGEFINHQLLSRSLKDIPNIQIKEKWNDFRKSTEGIVDGEFYNPRLNFQQITSMVMTEDIYTKESEKKWQKLCEETNNHISRKEAFEGMRFFVFDRVINEDYELPFFKRLNMASNLCQNSDLLVYVEHKLCNNAKEVEDYFNMALANGYEGLILRNPTGRYKLGRATYKEGLIFKLKPWEDFDAPIIEVVQATVVDENAEKKVNELGRSVTSKKKDDRIPIEMARLFVVEYEGLRLEVPIALPNDKKVEIWKNRSSYIGKYIEYEGMMIGSKDVPRIPRFKRFREDKD